MLRDGQTIQSGNVAGTTDSQIVSLMVGRNMQELFPQVPHSLGETIVSVDQLSGRRIPQRVSLRLRRGEILGIAGLVGAGRTELLRVLLALDVVRNGQVRVGQFSPAATPRFRIRAGLGMVSEDRKAEGLAQRRSLADNVTYNRLSPYCRAGFVNLRRRDATVRQWIDRMKIKSTGPD